MQVWIVCLVLFFGIAEFYQWAKGLSLPVPVLIAAGVLLAIASNLRSASTPSTPMPFTAPPAAAPSAAAPPTALPITAATTPVVSVQSSISFTIRSPESIVEE
jgi:phosphotransferase system  glucose/maltose/N-acetylglucosamine-specific IIC component